MYFKAVLDNIVEDGGWPTVPSHHGIQVGVKTLKRYPSCYGLGFFYVVRWKDGNRRRVYTWRWGAIQTIPPYSQRGFEMLVVA